MGNCILARGIPISWSMPLEQGWPEEQSFTLNQMKINDLMIYWGMAQPSTGNYKVSITFPEAYSSNGYLAIVGYTYESRQAVTDSTGSVANQKADGFTIVSRGGYFGWLTMGY